MRRSIVVLPQPLGPRSVKNSLARISTETPSRARTLPPEKVLTRSRHSTATTAARSDGGAALRLRSTRPSASAMFCAKAADDWRGNAHDPPQRGLGYDWFEVGTLLVGCEG